MAKRQIATLNPFGHELTHQTRQLGNLEAKLKEGQAETLQKIERARQRRDAINTYSAMADAATVAFAQERDRALADIKRGQTYLRRVHADRKIRRKQYAIAKREIDRIAGQERKALAVYTAAQQAVRKVEGEIANAKSGVKDLPEEIRRLRQTASQLGEKIDVGLKVQRYDVEGLASQIRKTLASLAALTKKGVIKQRLGKLHALSEKHLNAITALARAQGDLDRARESLITVQQKTHRVHP